MKIFKKLAAVAMSAAITAGSTFVVGISAYAGNNDYSVQEFKNNWSSIINAEKQKYPQTVNGKQCYWNGGNLESYTTTACNHQKNNMDNCNFMDQEYVYDSSSYDKTATLASGSGDYTIVQKYNCCMAFARKLQYDVFGTKNMVRYNLTNGIYSLPDGTKMLYYPQPGDLVRFDKNESDPERFPGHSIFLSDVSSNYQKINIAQSNAHDTCAIEWDSTTYGPRNEKIDLTYIRCYATYFERPMMEGDINLDGIANYKDANIFKNTIMKNGSTYCDCPLAMYDVSHDGKVDTNDYYDLLYGMNYSPHYYNQGRSVVSDWVSCSYKDSFCDNGLFYKKTSSNTATFVGTMNRTQTIIEVPPTVKDSATGNSYTVTEIGVDSEKAPMTDYINKIQTLSIPATVTKIGKKALYSCEIMNINIPTGSKLQKIDEYAFAYSKLKQVSFSDATSLTSIGNYAFMNCPSLRDFIAPYSLSTIGEEAFANCNHMLSFRTDGDGSGNCNLKRIENNTFKGCTSLEVVEIKNNLKYSILLGTDEGIFDVACHSKLYLPNTTSVQGILYLNDSDKKLFKDGKMTLFAGKYRIKNLNGISLVNKTSTSFDKVIFP
ncbi:leucine-rich repeat protein [Ruminococcus flavefaciens]|uniref:Dockerin domain-containing protein n=1 Tax=Ruminococcus flavefaciens 007c TaxID=1341157 RepID=W7URW3_RUMFL|nr:leucine-rich repeat protein [Ruminococcus flavefaciens]EWM54119.1 hypothetical protein RF007C_01215 [Ruminococcus flavefaciens 007c]